MKAKVKGAAPVAAQTDSAVMPDAAQLEAELRAALRAARAEASNDPFSNPILLQALELTRRLDRGEVASDTVAALVHDLTMAAFEARASRLAEYLACRDEAEEEGQLAALAHRLAGEPVSLPFDSFRARVERPLFGIVLTAHPTFSLDRGTARLLARLAAGTEPDGQPVDRAAVLAEASAAPHRPASAPTLDDEHDWSVEALHNAHSALERAQAILLGVAQARYPERWAELEPRPVTFASWVGYDQDGRSDVTWAVTLGKRLALKQALLERLAARLAVLARQDDAPPDLARLADEFGDAAAQSAALATELRSAEAARAGGDWQPIAAFGRRFAAAAAPVTTGAWRLRLGAAIAASGQPVLQRDIAGVRTSLAAHGLGLAHIHVRLNATQLHNAIRHQVGLDSTPDDPTRRRSYFNAIGELLDGVTPVDCHVGSLLTERTSAKRLFMTIALIMAHIDAETPVRFLIAETESGFTLLTALYFARLFGVADRIEISPLFETEEALARGEAVLEEALRNPHFRDHLRRQGRLAVQFGFSDSGRYLGQMAATFRIERLRLRLAQMLERHGLTDISVILFNTHGESVGRGGHAGSLADRLRYVAPPVNRAEFARRGIAVKEEVSFQGGDGFLPFLAPGTALSLLRGVLEFALLPDPEANGDPIYEDSDFTAEFFATVQQRFTRLVEDPDYAALLGVYGTNFLWRTGSRPVTREHEGWARPTDIAHPREMRAIPNNAVLQQLGMMANLLYGVGAAAAKDPARFTELRRTSPRFRRALALVEQARAASDLDVLRAYLAQFDPGMWLSRSGRTRDPVRARELRRLTGLCERLDLHDRLERVTRRLQADYLDLADLVAPAPGLDRETLILLHILRLSLMQRIFLAATHIPEFSPQAGTNHDVLLERILHMDVTASIDKLRVIFPRDDRALPADLDFGAPTAPVESYEPEHRDLFEPMLALHAQCRAISSALVYLIGAVG